MNKYQKEVEQQLLQNEKEILKELKFNYAKALREVKLRIKYLESNELTQSKIYQMQYQENLERQLQSIIDLLSSDNVQSISEYLEKTYEDGFIGTLYNMQNEGVPFIMPINNEAVIKSITKQTEDFQLSKTLYKNAEVLKKTIKAEITRGICTGSTYSVIAKKISLNSEADLKKAYRIARTEGGRVQSKSKFDCMTRAKANGADVVKEWDSTMDKRTRETHVRLDGQIRELEEPFEIEGKKAMYPHDFGIAEEDINCRCVVLERARWAIEEKHSFTKNIDGDIVEFENVKDYQDYKQKYFDFYKKDDKIDANNLLDKLNINADSYEPLQSNTIQEKTAKILKMDGLPTVVNNEKFNNIDGNEIVRYLRDCENVTADKAYDNTLYGKIQYSNIKNSQYGRGIYFGEKKDDEELLYFYSNGDGKAIKAKISKDANILEFNSMLSYIKDVTERTQKLPEDIRKVYEKERSLLYMIDGYDGIKIKSKGYYCIYNRKVLIINNGK